MRAAVRAACSPSACSAAIGGFTIHSTAAPAIEANSAAEQRPGRRPVVARGRRGRADHERDLDDHRVDGQRRACALVVDGVDEGLAHDRERRDLEQAAHAGEHEQRPVAGDDGDELQQASARPATASASGAGPRGRGAGHATGADRDRDGRRAGEDARRRVVACRWVTTCRVRTTFEAHSGMRMTRPAAVPAHVAHSADAAVRADAHTSTQSFLVRQREPSLGAQAVEHVAAACPVQEPRWSKSAAGSRVRPILCMTRCDGWFPGAVME